MRATGGAGLRRVKADTIQGNLAALRSIHIDYQLDAMVFDDPWLRRVVAGVRRVEPTATRRQATPITQSLLQELTSPTLSSDSLEDLNFDTAAKVAFAGFLRMDDELHAVLRLKRSKADIEHRGIDIVLAATGSTTCPVRAL
jgi:hypothetical protein